MIDISLIDYFQSIQTRLLAQPYGLLRLKANEILAKQTQACLLIGPRGAGKTTILLEKSRLYTQGRLLYFSADHPRLRGQSLYEFGEMAFLNGYDGILVDEVHYYRQWSQDLKALYDSHPNKIIWASDSSAGILRDGGFDLSRRFVQQNVPLLTFREFIHLKTGTTIDAFNPFAADAQLYAKILATPGINVLGLFKEYVERGLRPIFFEGDYDQKITAILEKTIHSDIPYLVEDMKSNHLMVMSAVIRALVMNPIPTINIASMCKEWEIGKEKLYALLAAMETIGLISIAKRKSDQAAYSKGAKIFMADPSVYSVFKGNNGSRREALVYFFLKSAGINLFASKDEMSGDFESDTFSVEVGGASKKKKKSDFVIRDDIDMPAPGVIPLWALGMML